jgi:hypothetical protein
MKNVKLPLQIGLLFVMLSVAVVQTNAQPCDPVPEGDGESISASLADYYTGVAITDLATVAPWTFVKIHSRAEAQGRCKARTRVEGICVLNGIVWERTVNHTSVYADIVSSGLNGTYFLGNVYGINPNYTTAFWHVLDTHNSDSTGPIAAMASYPGSYTYRIKAYIDTTPCNMDPGETQEVSTSIYVGSDEELVATLNGPRRLPENYIVVRNTGFFGNARHSLLSF